MTQDRALEILKTGANVFLTGEPGSGKTHTINQYVKYLHEHDIDPAVTASTGIAATHIGGMTIHSWSGIGIKKVLAEEDLDQMASNEKLSRRVSKATVLIIDEISMLSADTLSNVDKAVRALRRREEPFGGMQVIFVGDFFQLPPVSRGIDNSEFAFMSPSWAEAKVLTCYLSEQHRQEDPEFLSFLSIIRRGEITDDTHLVLAERKIEIDESHSHTRLYSHNVDVDRVNSQKLEALPGESHAFEMESRGSNGAIMSLKKGCLSPERLLLKKGAQVMFTKNSFEEGFVNGTLGEVESFREDGNPIVRTKQGVAIEVEPLEWSITDGSRTLGTIVQLPLRLAWAITVHKSQGMTLDSAVMDLSQSFEYGQGYVALSRIKSFSGLHLLGHNHRALEVHPKILTVDGDFRQASDLADEVFEKMSLEERVKMEKNFIRACGGKVEKISPKAKKLKSKKISGQTTYDVTFDLWKSGNDIAKISSIRGVTQGTVINHFEELFMKGRILKKELSNIIPESLDSKLPEIYSVFKKLGTDKLAPVFEKLEKKYSYDDLKIARLIFEKDS
jgi:hypothetical protein